MPTKFTINASGVTGGKDRTDLVGCHFVQNTDNYQFTAPDNTVLSTNGPPLPSLPFNFPNFVYDEWSWTIAVNTLTGGPANNQPGGTWFNTDVNITNEEGTWTAQAGSGEDEDKEDAAAAYS